MNYVESMVDECKQWVDKGYPLILCRGKYPIEKGWQQGKFHTLDEIKDHLKSHQDATVGLPTGSLTRIIGVDADGDAGEKELINLRNEAGIKLPPTWAYMTANGGLRQLYEIPDGFEAKKYTITLEGKHEELAFLGNGQQTIIPCSEIKGVGSYRWLEGLSPKDISLAPAPDFILKLMSSHKSSNECVSTKPGLPLNHAISKLASKCQKFKEAIQIQQGSGLDEETWFRLIALLVKTGNAEAAKIFSEMSLKHDQRSQERIESLLSDNSKGLVRCTTLGCDKEQIKRCHNKLRVKKSDPSVIVNSPGVFILPDTKVTPQYESVGISLDENGNPLVNGNKFARFAQNRLNLAYSSEGQFYRYTDGVYKVFDDYHCSKALRNIFQQYAPDKWTKNYEAIYMNPLKYEAPYIDKMNLEKRHINLKNGILNTDTYEIIPHSPVFYSSIRIPITYNSMAKCNKFMKFLLEICSNNQQLVDTIQEIMGYCLTSETKADKAFLFYGKGANGKSVLLKIISELVGNENVSSVSFADLNKPFARADLMNKTVNLVTESEVSGRAFNTEYFKAIVTGDAIRVERKFGPSITYTPSCKILIALNSLPYSNDKTDGFFRRLLIIPFKEQFKGRVADRNLLQKLLEELPGILNFALEGLKRLRSNQYMFTECDAINKCMADYKTYIEPFTTFLNDCVVQSDPTSKVSYIDLQSEYMEWCCSNGLYVSDKLSPNAFASKLKKALDSNNYRYEVKRISGQRYVYGIIFKQAKFREMLNGMSLSDPSSSVGIETIDNIDSIDSM